MGRSNKGGVIDMVLAQLGVPIRFTLQQWSIIEELLQRENISLNDRCELCEKTIKDKSVLDDVFFTECSQIHLEQLQHRKKEVEKILAKLESEEL